MKKALSLILAIMMVFALSTTAFAAEVEDLVGYMNNTEYSGINKGIAPNAFTGNVQPGTTIAITATQGEVQHRYAVDIAYDKMNFNIAGSNLVWNVVTLQYDSVGGAGLADQNFGVTITNYSDLPVYLTTTVTDGDNDDGVVVTTDKSGVQVAANTEIVSAATGSTTPYEFNVLVKADGKTWDEVATYYVRKFAATPLAESFTVATLGITISKDAPLP